MRLARRALFAALVMLVLCAAASAQTLRLENDPRNQSPSVGTGGPEGGPTGLFTIYDGSTIRKGEFTFSIAYSNFDRDPGNVDISDIPLSFNVGLNDHIELFFKTNAYRGIKVNNPLNLSSFYLPNVQVNCGSLSTTGSAAPGGGRCSPAAIVQFSTGPSVGNLGRLAVFRPLNNQPFVQFPFIGGSAGTFLQGPGARGTPFGFPGFSASLSTPIVSSNSGTFSGADNFPGIGSPVGSILPGIVLSSTVLPCTALTGACSPFGGGTPLNPLVVPTTFTIAPSYLPDAPFVSRLYGESSFTNYVAGAKIRLTDPNNPLGVGLIPFYRWYPDKADSFSGFNQMQRGSGPGGDIGDFGLIGFVDGRLSRSVNISANFGYILNSNPKSNLGTNTKFVLLDRPDEVIAGVGFDFPVTKHFQPVVELRSTQYVGGRTPNAFENSPVDGLIGVKIYPRRWWGLGLAYRRHLNQQDQSTFNRTNFNTQINQVSGIFVPGRGVVIVPGTTRPATNNGLPNGFNESDDPNGFMVQLWAGRRNERIPSILPNQPPTVTLAASSSSITVGCPPGTSDSSCTPSASQSVQLTANATDPDGDTLLYTYTTTGGRITGEGPNVTWDLTGVTPGTYTASVEVDDGCGCISFSSTQVTVGTCAHCVPPCPTVNVSCPDSVDAGSPVTFTANVAGGDPNLTPTYNWSVSAGTISSGQGTSSITVDTTGTSGQTITATVELGGVEPTCTRTASCTASVRPLPNLARKFDTYGNIKFNDEKARLDNYAIQLQNEPGSQGYIIAYGSCTGEGQARADRAKDYLVNTRGIDAGRIVTVDGGCRSELTVELWIVPSGATPPAADTSGAVDPCPDCKVTKKPRRAPRRHRRGGSEEE
ncbi:MAG: hypothetical protein QOD00_2805 [Blastocatellia bacterium]|nr:hypothetical protein [Blastocatellia bacterium]